MIDYITFGRNLLDTYDLDPLYVILADINMPERMLKRFLLAYWIFYSAGVAAKVAESKDFFGTLIQGDIDHWPRGHERRHLRGNNFKNCMTNLMLYHAKPETLVDCMTYGKNFQSIAVEVQKFCGFGPWISWKIADMTERVLCKPVDFSNAELGVYRDPVKGAALIKFGDQKHAITTDELYNVVKQLLKDFKGYMAPPYQDRPLNIQEIETILCKYKSYVNGHYPLGNDTMDIYHGLQGWGDLAQQLSVSLEPYYRMVSND
jgi:hypothetical protein